VFKHEFIRRVDLTRIALILPVSQQVMTSLIKSHVEYLISLQTCLTLVLIL